MYILGEILSFLAAATLAYSTFSAKKERMIWWQGLNTVFYGFSNLCLGGYAAVVTNVLSLVRNILVVKKKLNTKYTLIICALMAIIGWHFNNRGAIGLLPIFASIQYTLCIFYLKSAQQMRIALIINLIPWMIFDFSLTAYPTCITYVVIMVVTFVNIIRYRKTDEKIDLNNTVTDN